MYNFATASMSPEDLAAKLADIQKDAMALLNEGGITKFNAAVEWRGEAAAMIRESVIDTFKMTDSTPIFTERREGKQGDSYEFEQLINTLRVVEYSPQSDPQAFTPRKGLHTIKTNTFELAYGIPLQKVMNGQHTLGEFAGMAAEALTRHYNTMTLTAVDSACGVGATDMRGRPLRTVAAGADVTKPEIDAALRRMYAYNSGVTIFGSRYALDAIYTHGASQSEALANELNGRGVIGRYRGATMVEMVDDHNLFYQSFSKVNGVDLEKLLFISAGTTGAILLEKDLSALDWEEMNPRTAQWRQGVRFESGILVHSPHRYHVIQLA
jgi:hypothetical protein